MTSGYKKLKRPDGFILIIAVGIVFLLMIFAISLQITTTDTYENLKGTNNYLQARAYADSAIEYANYILKDRGPGYSSEKITCAWGKYANNEGEGQNQICQEFDWMGLDANGDEMDVKVTFEIKGRAEEEEKIKTTKCGGGRRGFSDDCYVVPFQGTGDANKNCKAYDYDNGETTIDPSLNNGLGNIDHLDYSCNWNKLIFGSSIVDRVTIPLYYEGDQGIVNPFKGDDPAADNFLLKVRTPCKPCGVGGRNCGNQVTDETVCNPGDRYELDTDERSGGGDQIVVQWKLSGKCDTDQQEDDSCAVVAVPDPRAFSAIYESFINLRIDDGDFKILEEETLGNYLNVFPTEQVTILIPDREGRLPKLHLFTQPTLSLFLSGALIDVDGNNIPYLEYQLLTDEPVAGPNTIIDVEVLVDGNGFSKTAYKPVKKELLDFAVQN